LNIFNGITVIIRELYLFRYYILDVSVKDMEAAAIAWVAKLNNTPFFALKVVTDIVDGDR